MASAIQDMPLIRSKIQLPRRQPTLLRRERLVEFLHEHVDNKLILVSAGAGYGKTSLLVDYCHDTELPVCWYSLDRNDSHIFTFLEYLVAAIRQRYPSFGESVLQAVRAFEGPEEAVEPFVRLLVNEIQESIPDYFVLVLDDYHHVTDSATVNALLDGLLLWLPEHCHIILASRGIPRRLTLTRLARDRSVAGVGYEMLAFTADEIRELLESLGYDDIGPTQAEELASRSEGWITGVLLAAQSDIASNRQFVDSSLASSGVFEFMATEILEQQPQDLQDFMLGTSLLREMSAPLCDALLDIDNSASLLNRLAQDNLFISRTDVGDSWYQYHQLYREFLLGRLESRTPKRYHDLCVAHADLMVNQGHWPEAIAAYLDAQAYDEAAEAIEIVAAETIDAGNRSRACDWIDTLPASTLDQHPRLLVHRGHIASELGEPIIALDFLDRARSVYEELGDVAGAARAIVRTAFPQRARGRYHDAIAACRLALDLSGEQDARVALMAHSQTSICYGIMGDLEASLEEMSRALQIAQETGDDVNAAYAVTDMGNIEINRGNLAQAKVHLHQALLYWRKIGNQGALSSTLQGLGLVHHHLGQYADASARLSQAMDSARAAQDGRLEAYSLANMGDLKRDTGHHIEAQEFYEKGIERACASQSSYLLLYLQAAKGESIALRALGSNADRQEAPHDTATDLLQAEQLLIETLDQVDAEQMRQEAGLAHLAMALVKLAQELPQKAVHHTDIALTTLAGTGYQRDRARAHLVAAIVKHRLGSPVDEHLAYVAELVQQIGSHQFIVAFGPLASPLLQDPSLSSASGLEAAAIRAEILSLFPPEIRQAQVTLVQQGASLELLALDGGQVLEHGQIVTAWEADAARLLAFLLAAHPQGLERDQVTEMLWPQVSLARGSSRCYSTLHRLRNALGKDIVVRQSNAWRLNPDLDVRYDAAEFTRLAQLSTGSSPASSLARQQAIALYKTDYLGTCDLDWCDETRQALRVALTRLLHQEGLCLMHQPDFDQALALYTRLQAMDPLDERAHRGILRCHHALNDIAGVVRQWQTCQQILHDELDVEPSPETRALAMAIIDGRPLPAAT